MNLLKLLLRNLQYYKNSQLGTILGTALATAIIIASLTVGSSVQYSLEKIVKDRLGNTGYVIVSNNRFFKSSLADRLEHQLKTKVASVLQYKGIAISTAEGKRINTIQINGIDAKFWSISGNNNPVPELKDDEVVINQKLSAELNLNLDDEFILRIPKSGFVPVNTPFVSDDVNSISKRVRIKKIISESESGNFNLRTNQIAPFNIFISRTYLSYLLLQGSFANLLLVDENSSLSHQEISESLNSVWSISDISYNLKRVSNTDFIELNTKRVFIDEPIQNEFLKIDKSAVPLFTYFVNSIRKGTAETPYSFVCSPGIAETESLSENEVILNTWTADDLNATVGDTIFMTFFVTDYYKELIEKSEKFIVRKIISMKTIWADSSLIPGIDGLSDVEKCTDWKAGIPVNLKKIRTKDEDYWKHYKGTPKAYVSYKTAVRLWSTNYGKSTAIRCSRDIDTTQLKIKISENIKPEQLGITVISVKDEGRWSALNAVDFNGLFIGLSFFLLLASIILISLLFSMQTELRVKEHGVLLALGIPKRIVKRLFYSEGFFIAFVGVLLGVLPGLFFSKLVFYLLNNIWIDIIRTSSIELHFDFISILSGCIIGLFVSFGTIMFVIWRKSLLSINNLQRRNIFRRISKSKVNVFFSLFISVISITCAILLIVLLLLRNDYQNQSFFFLSGALLLTGSLFLVNYLLIKPGTNHWKNFSVFALIFRNLYYRKKSVLSLLSIVSIAIFLVISVGLNRTDFSLDYTKRDSGTGGYIFFCETTIPVTQNLNFLATKKKYGIDILPESVSYNQIKILPGDDASCLNLNRAVRPRIIAVNPDKFAIRNSFSFAEVLKTDVTKNPWALLNDSIGQNIIPAIADQTVIKWGLGKNIGDTILYTNEFGEKIYLKLVGGLESSIFQGNIIISEDYFLKHFPSVYGSNIFLVEANKNDLAKCKDTFIEAFQTYGIRIIRTDEQLQMFNSVTNTYLSIFLSIGGIALIIGIIGLAVIIFRNISNQKNEFAMMQAVGLNRKSLVVIILREYLIVVFSGLFIGLFAAILSVYPSLKNSSQLFFVLILLSVFIANAVIWVVIASNKSLKKDFLIDLRNE